MADGKVSVEVGAAAPGFALPARSGRLVTLADYRGRKNVLLYFYPKDDTPGCTKEACSLRDGWAALRAHDVEVLGVSRDDAASHNAFAAKYRLPFELLTDALHEVHEAYGAWGESPWGVGPLRRSFLIDKNGVIRHVFHKVDTEHHAEEVLKAMESSNPPGSQPPAPPAAPVVEAVEKAAQAVQATVTEAAKGAKEAVESAAKAAVEKADTARTAVEKAVKTVAKKAAKRAATAKKAVQKAAKKVAKKVAPKKKAAPKKAKKAARKAAPKKAKKAARKAAPKKAKKAARKPARKATKKAAPRKKAARRR